MSVDLRSLSINNMISHIIFRRDQEGNIVTPHYSNAEIPMNEQMKSLLTDRIVGALGKNSKSMEMKITKFGQDSVFNNVLEIISSNEKFVNESIDITNKLVSAQTSKNYPGGAVVVFKGKVGINRNDCIGVIKAEKHNGFNVIESPEKIMLELLESLILTPQQKLYKIGLFVKTTSGITPISVDHFSAVVFDTNMNQGNNYRAAQYFYETFLGFSHSDNAKKITNDFYNYTKDFINAQESFSAEERYELFNALNAYVRADISPTINIEEFSNRYFNQPEMKDDYRGFMAEKEIPDRDFIKDVELIKKHFKKRKYLFSNNIKIEVPYENIDGKMKIIEETMEKTVIEVYGTIKEE